MSIQELDKKCMAIALEEARLAYEEGEVPIGAIIVDQYGDVVAKGHNQVIGLGRQSAHAEMMAIDRACETTGDWRLDGHMLYVTLEPCGMCIGLARLSRLSRVVYGADSPIFGHQLDNEEKIQIYRCGAPEIFGGVCASESVGLLRTFFKEKREKSGE